MPKPAEGKSPPPAFSPWFVAGYDGECDECGTSIEVGDEIRRVDTGYQGRECCGETDAPGRRDPFVSTSIDEMGY